MRLLPEAAGGSGLSNRPPFGYNRRRRPSGKSGCLTSYLNRFQ